uniref:Protein prenyltransferase alpha subunit repeat-containing protein 1 n=1 Tax=Schistocephalus solidus TaxID=70667 RepID=A0A0X3PXT6_SCHSO
MSLQAIFSLRQLRRQTLMDTDIVQFIAKLARMKTEYDIIPHVDSGKHDLIQEVDESFGICSCVASFCWKLSYAKLMFEGNVAIDVSYFLLLFAPACLVVWNRRKSLVESGSLSPLEELAFTGLILRRHPRVTEPLQQRQWIMQYLISSETFDLSTELDFCELLADKHRCNYAVWDYRRWLFKECLARSPTVRTNLRSFMRLILLALYYPSNYDRVS